MTNYEIFSGINLRSSEWNFTFGFVIPNSTNCWQSTIEADPNIDKVPIEFVSGKIIIETLFYDGDCLIGKNVVRVVYI